MVKKKIDPKQLAIVKRMTLDPLYFVEKCWGLTVERDNTKFIKGEHITWQQADMLEALRKAVNDEGSWKISISSGRGIGKTTFLSWAVLWGLFRCKDSQIACTAPNSKQMYDVLWKELSLWIQKLPETLKGIYEWKSEYIRMKESPSTWFASAKTARKENPEALAGVHGQFVMLVADEASGVSDAIFKTAEAGLTDERYIFIVISNQRRLTGFFRETQREIKGAWQKFQFSNLDSPLSDGTMAKEIATKYGEDSDDYRVEVLGLPPKEDMMDNKGYIPIVQDADLRKVQDIPFVGEIRLGVDPAGEGKDETIWVARDKFKMKILAREKKSTVFSIAQKTMTLMTEYDIKPENVYVDNFGVGANVSQELALNNLRVNAVNVGNKADDDTRFVNKRAECFWRLREALKRGMELVKALDWEQILLVRYKSNLKGLTQIMSKDEMRRSEISSPDIADAASLTFYAAESTESEEEKQSAFDDYVFEDYDGEEPY